MGSVGGSTGPAGGGVFGATGCIMIVASPDGSSGAPRRGDMTVGKALGGGGGTGACGVCGTGGTGGY